MALIAILAQTNGDEDASVDTDIEIVEPSRPVSDWLVRVFDLDPDGATADVLSWVVEPLFQIVLTIAIALLGLRLLRRVGRKFIDKARVAVALRSPEDPRAASRRNQRLDAAAAVLNSVAGVVVWLTAVLVILVETFGISLAPFFAGAGILGIAVGFGAKDLIKDFVSGLFMLAEDQYAVGDVIDVGDATGTVERITLRTTRLRAVDGTVWHFPNGEIRRVGNSSQEWSRALLDVGVAYGADIDRAAEVMLEVAKSLVGDEQYSGRLLAPPEVQGVQDMASDAVVIRMVIQTLPGEQWVILRELRRRIKLSFDQEGIEIPFPQRTVWIRDGEPPEDTDEPSSSGPVV